MLRDLHPVTVDGGHAVEDPCGGVVEEHRGGAADVELHAVGTKPEQGLSADLERPHASQQIRCPRPWRQHEAVREQLAVGGRYGHAVTLATPRRRGHPQLDVRASQRCLPQAHRDTVIDGEHPRAGLEDRPHPLGHTERGPSLRDLVRVEAIDLQAVGVGAALEASDHHAVARTDLQHPGLTIERALRARLELGPQRVRAAKERQVVRVLEVGPANEPSRAVGAPAIVGRRVAVDAEHGQPATGELIERSAADSSNADDDDVVPFHHASLANSCAGSRNDLNSRALPAGSRTKNVPCSPTSPANLTLGSMMNGAECF